MGEIERMGLFCSLMYNTSTQQSQNSILELSQVPH